MGIKVLSLFDGISCGMLALQRAGIEVDTYYASEIDEYALKISQHHFPEIIQLGNVEEWQNWNIPWGDKHEWDRANPDRKYTMEELEMLQTLPIKYTDVGGGHGRRRKAIGNCWTVDMIVEILKMI